ncbi:MAG: hypothetical protein FJ271_05175 [Planctomycetes bacterium]|nr:hypothetical protein [Planctomycetota bacterium]
MSNFAGQWYTTFGPMTLSQQGGRVSGVYHSGDAENTIDGEIHDGILHFRYQEPAIAGDGQFMLSRHGMFQGQWRPDGEETWRPWQGHRQFDGIWNTRFGLMRLFQEPEQIYGFFEGTGGASLQGTLAGNRLTFRYQEPNVGGQGYFELSPDCYAFDGRWLEDGRSTWGPWEGRRLVPRPDVRWLVVLEANWQSYLLEKEYSFGAMLREFFARVSGVEVRHRYFNNEAALALLCRDLVYLPEPAILVIASHGTPEGLATRAGSIGPRVLIDNLKHADTVGLLHFSSCLVMDGAPTAAFNRALQEELRFPISGYASSVDWAASALIEFTYLDMILSKGLPPSLAADQVPSLLAFAGDKPIPGSPYPPACFRIWLPGSERVDPGADRYYA